jgi:hypothetical protein
MDGDEIVDAYEADVPQSKDTERENINVAKTHGDNASTSSTNASGGVSEKVQPTPRFMTLYFRKENGVQMPVKMMSTRTLGKYMVHK